MLKLQFCPTCKSVLLPIKKDNKILLTCRRCGYSTDEAAPVVQPLNAETARKGVVVISSKDEENQPMPKIKIQCPKCGNEEATYWTVQTRGGDEATTQFFKCTKCGKTWRESA